MIQVSTPSRICLFGEHQDYLGLEVIASAINLRFSTKAEKRSDSLLRIRIRDKSICELGAKTPTTSTKNTSSTSPKNWSMKANATTSNPSSTSSARPASPSPAQT